MGLEDFQGEVVVEEALSRKEGVGALGEVPRSLQGAGVEVEVAARDE